MSYVHIILAWVIFVILIAVFFISKVCLKQNLVSNDIDFFTAILLKKKQILEKNDTDMTLNTYISILICSPIVLGISIYIISNSAVLSVIISLCSMLIPEVIIMTLQQKANKQFEERYARSLEQLSFSLKAGLSILQSVQEVANNKFIHESLRTRYRRLSTDLQMGISVTEAFKRFAESTNSQDAKDVALAIDIQNEIGGHESDIIMSIAKDIHDRIMLRKELKSMFSGTTSMIYIMDVLPLVVILFLCSTDSTYINFYFSNTGNIVVLLIILGTCLTGSFINHSKLRKIMKGA